MPALQPRRWWSESAVGAVCFGLLSLKLAAAAPPLLPSVRFQDACGRRDADCVNAAAAEGCGPPLFFRHVGRLWGHLPWVGRHTAEATPLQPPMPRFHPVPTRPVFEPRHEYSAPYALDGSFVPQPPLGASTSAPYAHWERDPPPIEPAYEGPPPPVETFELLPPPTR